MGMSAIIQLNVVSPNLERANQQAQAQHLQGAIAQAKSTTANINVIFKPAKLSSPLSDVTVFSSGLGGLRRGDTKVTYGNYSEYGSNILQLAGALVTLPVTGTMGAFISAIYASAEFYQAYKCHQAGDKKGTLFHLAVGGISAIAPVRQMLKAFGILKSAKVTQSVAARMKTAEEIKAGFAKLRRVTVHNNEIFLGQIKKISMGQTPYLLLEDLSKQVPPKIQQRILNWVTNNGKDLNWINIDNRVSELDRFCYKNLSRENNFSYSILIKEFLNLKKF